MIENQGDHISEVFRNILGLIKEASIILESQDFFNQLLSMLVDKESTSLIAFEKSINEEAGLDYSYIKDITIKLAQSQRCRQAAGVKLLKSYLKFKTIDLFTITVKRYFDVVEECSTLYMTEEIPLQNFIRQCAKRCNENDEDNIKYVISELESDKIIKQLDMSKTSINQQKQNRQENLLRLQEIKRQLKRKQEQQQEQYRLKMIEQEKIKERQIQERIKSKQALQNLAEKLFTHHINSLKSFFSEYKESFEKLSCDLKEFPKNSIGFKVQQLLLKSYKQTTNKIDLKQQFKMWKERLFPQQQILLQWMKKIIQENSPFLQLKKLKQKLLQIDVFQLIRLVEKNQITEQQIKGKDAIVLIGQTGAGKSTIILKFLNYTLKEGEVKGLKTLETVEPLSPLHTRFKTSPERVSCTDSISAAKIPEEMYYPTTSPADKNLYICDTPGFGDSKGTTMDIANGVGMMNAIYSCLSIRIVLIITSDDIQNLRGRGLRKLGQTVSGLFCGFSNIRKSIKIYFNKLRTNSPEMIQKLIKNTIQNLNAEESNDTKLITFLRIIEEQSMRLDNYLDPFANNYKDKLDHLVGMNRITKIKQTFRYNFTQNTKKDLQIFINSEVDKVKQYYKMGDYQNSAFHLSILSKIKEKILKDKETDSIYKETCKYLIDQSQKLLNINKKLLFEMAEAKTTSKSMLQSFNQTKEHLQRIDKYLFSYIKVSYVGQLNQEIKDTEQKMFKLFEHGTLTQKENICKSTIIFKDILLNLQKQIRLFFEEQFKIKLQCGKLQISNENFAQVGQVLAKLNEFIIFQNIFNGQLAFQDQYNTLVQEIQEKTAFYIKQLTKISQFSKIKITQESIQKTKLYLSKTQSIISISSLPSNKDKAIAKIRDNLKKVFIKKGEQYIRELLELSEDSQISKKFVVDMKEQKSKILHLFELDFVRESLQSQYNYSFKIIQRNFNSSSQFLKQTIQQFHNDNITQISKNIVKIRRATQIIQQFSAAMDINVKDTLQEIKYEFTMIIIQEKDRLQKFSFDINSLYDDSLYKDLDSFWEKMQCFKRFATIFQQVNKIIEEWKTLFYKKLQLPLKKVYEASLSGSNEKYFLNMIDKLDKIAYFSMKMKERLLEQEYSEKISTKSKQIIQKMKTKIHAFLLINLDGLQNIQINDLKCIFQNLACIKAKKQLSNYLNNISYFDVCTIIEDIVEKLSGFQEEIEQKARRSAVYQDFNKLLQISKIIISFYQKLEINHIKISKKCQELSRKVREFMEHLASRFEGVIKAQKLNFEDIEIIYHQLSQLNTNQARTKKIDIENLFLKRQRGYLDCLDQYLKALEQNQIVEEISQFHQFLQSFSQIINFTKKTTEIFKDKEILKKLSMQYLRQQGNRLKKQFQHEFDSLLKKIQRHDIYNLNETIQFFGKFENIIISLYYNGIKEQDNNILENSSQQFFEILSQESINIKCNKPKDFNLDNYRNKLKEEFYKLNIPETEKEEIRTNNSMRLKNMFRRLCKIGKEQTQFGLEKSVQLTNIDQRFKAYYQSIESQKKEAQINRLNQKIQNYFIQQFKQYQNKYFKSEKEKEYLKDKLLAQINYLPRQLIFVYKRKLQEKQRQVDAKFHEKMNERLDQMNKEPRKLLEFIEDTLQAHKQDNIWLEDSYISKLRKFLKALSQKYKDISILEFMYKYLKPFDHHQLTTKLQEVYDQMFCLHVQKIVKIFDQRQKLVEETLQSIVKEESFMQITKGITDIYKIYSFFKTNQFKNVAKISQFNKQVDQKLTMLLKNLQSNYLRYKQKIESKWMEISQKSLVNNNISLQDTMRRFINYGKAINLIQQQNKRIKKIPQITIQYNYESVLLRFRTDFINKLEQLKLFEFYNKMSKNLSTAEIQSKLQEIQHILNYLDRRFYCFNSFIAPIFKDKGYNFTDISNELQRKIQMLQKQVFSEIEQLFSNIAYKSNEVSNFYFQFYNIVNIKRHDFAKCIERNEQNQKITILIQRMFTGLKDKIQHSIKQANNQLSKYSEFSEKSFSKLQDAKKNLVQQFNSNKANKLEQIVNTYQQKMNLQPDIKKKNDISKTKEMQLNSVTKQFGQLLKAQIEKQQEKQSAQTTKIKMVLQEKISDAVTKIIHFKKNLVSIRYNYKIHQNYFDSAITQITSISSKKQAFIGLIIKELQKRTRLKDGTQSIAQILLLTHKIFSAYAVKQRNEITRAQNIDYVIKELKKKHEKSFINLNQQEKEDLKDSFQMFMREYNKLKNIYKQFPTANTKNIIKQEAIDLGQKLRSRFYFSQDPQIPAYELEILLAKIFAFLAIMKSEENEQGSIEYIFQPHPTQICTLLLLIGTTQNNRNISNRFMQVGTGQGKSVILGTISIFLALVGFEVKCACYSSYLSQRDGQSFKSLFEKFNVEGKVKYGTFNELCQDILKNDKTNRTFKDMIESVLLGDTCQELEQFAEMFNKKKLKISSDDKTILIIDQVDVFFDQNFFGKNYCPAITLQGRQMQNLLSLVWKESKNKEQLSKSNILNSQQFKVVASKYPLIVDILKNQVNGIISAALNYKHDYLIVDNQIMYKDNDSISNKTSLGYKTVFANMNEYQAGRVSKTNMEKSLYINLAVAQFAYSCLPLYFTNIMGVSGTLDVMPSFKKTQLQDKYHIHEQYLIPSAFGINKSRTQQYIFVPQAQHSKKIVEKIKQINEKCPIIIFFSKISDLAQFYHHQQYKPFIERTIILTEQHDAQTRDLRILKATAQLNITLMTDSFGRGTDFIIFDKSINQIGGLHIIQTFLSQEESEEVQIKGRTARQQNRGAFYAIIKNESLQLLNLKIEDILGDEASKIREARDRKAENLSSDTLKIVLATEVKHNKIIGIIENKITQPNEIVKYVFQLNRYPQFQIVNIKTIIGLDATGSMAYALQKTCLIIGAAFERVYHVLNQNNLSCNFEVKLMVYRNYNSTYSKILESTSFQNRQTYLIEFLKGVKPSGGAGHEALQVFFQAVNKQEQVDQIILIGDAASNTPSETKSRRKSNKGEQYWIKNGFPETNIDIQMEKFQEKFNNSCPVHTFYLDAQDYFRNLSNITNGKSEKFSINSPKATESLSNFINESILKIIGDKGFKGKGEQLVLNYRKIYVTR